MLDRIQLIKSDVSAVNMSISLDGNIKNLPETIAVMNSVTAEDARRLLTAINAAFTRKDLTQVDALYSYAVLFSEKDQLEIKQETIQDFSLYITGCKNEVQVNELFMHAGFSRLISALNDKGLTDLQFKLFSRYHLDDKTPIGKRMAKIQKNLPIDANQKELVVDYINEMTSETNRVEKKDHTKSIILIIVTIVLVLARIAFRMSRN